MPVKLPYRVKDRDLEREYEHMCHAIHVSPSAHYLLGSLSRLPLLGLQQHLAIFVGNILAGAEAFIASLVRCDLLVPDARLYNRSLSEIDGYRDCVQQVGEVPRKPGSRRR